MGYSICAIICVSGIALAGVGIWVQVNKAVARHIVIISVTQPYGSLLGKIAKMFIVFGVISLVVGLLGYCGARREDRYMLFTSGSKLLILVAGSIAGPILLVINGNQVVTNIQVSYLYYHPPGIRQNCQYQICSQDNTHLKHMPGKSFNIIIEQSPVYSL